MIEEDFRKLPFINSSEDWVRSESTDSVFLYSYKDNWPQGRIALFSKGDRVYEVFVETDGKDTFKGVIDFKLDTDLDNMIEKLRQISGWNLRSPNSHQD